MSEMHSAPSEARALRRKHEPLRRESGQARQAAKIKELRKALLALGYRTLSQQAAVLGLKRPTVWAIFNYKYTRGGLSSHTVKQLLAAKGPQEVRQIIREYVSEKFAGAYGHNHSALQRFRVRVGTSADLD